MSKDTLQANMRSALKWAGGKKRVIGEILKVLPTQGKKRLIEPFVGGGSVFLTEGVLKDTNDERGNLHTTIAALSRSSQTDERCPGMVLVRNSGWGRSYSIFIGREFYL